jgi:hypothetical protein
MIKRSNLLNGISYKNRLYLGAQYLQGSIRIQQNRLDDSVESFRKISAMKGPVAYYDEDRIKQISNLALGRVFYEKRNYPLSILYYKKVKRDSEFYPTALYEASWGLVQNEQVQRNVVCTCTHFTARSSNRCSTRSLICLKLLCSSIFAITPRCKSFVR